MGFWHTGYIEFHQPVGLDEFVYHHPPPASYVCEQCAQHFADLEALRRHRFEQHPLRQPSLLVRGRAVGQLPLDANARPFRERLELDISIDENLVLKIQAWSMNQKGRAEDEVHDLEFALATPGANAGWVRSGLLDSEANAGGTTEPGDLMVRSNLAARQDNGLVPGEVMARVNPSYFWTHTGNRPPQIQVEERLYYEPCAVCKRASNDPLCRCATSATQFPEPQVRPLV